MRKVNTKTAENIFYQARTAAIKENGTFKSREGAARILGLDRTRIANIELGNIIAYPEEILVMADGYNAPELENYYCCSICPLGKKTVVPAELMELDRLALKVLKALKDTPYITDTIIDIADDGIISDSERPKLKKVLAELEEIEKITRCLKLWCEKYLDKE